MQPLPPLVFARQGNIWRSDGTAAEPRQLTDFGLLAYVEHPAVSPVDGRIAFVRVSSPSSATVEANPQAASQLEYELMVMDADGSNQQVVWELADGQLLFPSWSADGSALFVTTAELLAAPDASGRSETRIQGMHVSLDGGAAQVVVQDALGLTMAPDGSGTSYLQLHKPGFSFGLMVAAPDDSEPQEILPGDTFQTMYGVRFSPDSQRLVFVAMGGPPTDEQGNPLAVRQPSLIERAIGLLKPPVAEAHGDPWGVWTINRDGTGLRLVFTLYHEAPSAAFSPDGSQLAVMDSSGVYLLQADGSQAQLVSPEGDSGGLVWVP